MAWESMPFFNYSNYKCIETPSCHSNQTRRLIFRNNIKSVYAYLMNISVNSQLHRAYGFKGDNILTIFFFHLFFIIVSRANQYKQAVGQNIG